MDESDKTLLKRSLELAEENHKILLGMRRSARWSTFFRFIYWLIILGGLGFSYYYLQPYLETVFSAYESIQGNLQEIQRQQNSLPDLRKILDNLGGSR